MLKNCARGIWYNVDVEADPIRAYEGGRLREIVIDDYGRLLAFWKAQPGIHLNDADSRKNIEC